MKRLSAILLFCIGILLSLPPAAAAQTDGWEPVVPGAVDYQKFIAPGPNEVFVARLYRDNPDAIIDSSLGQGRISGGTETVTNMAKRYDQAVNYWGESWGGRNQVVVGINGFYYGPEIMSHRESPGAGRSSPAGMQRGFMIIPSGFVWRLDRTPFIGRCINHRPEKQIDHSSAIRGSARNWRHQ